MWAGLSETRSEAVYGLVNSSYTHFYTTKIC